MKDDIRYPRKSNPVWNRFVYGPVESVPDYRDVVISGDLILPIPEGEVGQVFLMREEFMPWDKPMWDTVSTKTIGGPGKIVCKPERFLYRMQTYGKMWKEERVREHIEQRFRRSLIEAATDRFIINMKAEIL